MAATEILAVGTGLLNSGDQIATPGMELAIKAPAGRNTTNDVGVVILAKTTLGYEQVAFLNAFNPVYVFGANMTFQVERLVNSGSVGVDIIGTGNAVTGSNVDSTALVTLTAAAVGVNSADQTNNNSRGVQVGINVTAITGTAPTLLVTVQGKDAASGVYYTLLASAAITAVGFTLLTIYPGGPTTANAAAPQVLPRTWRIITVIGGTTPAVTATIGASVIL